MASSSGDATGCSIAMLRIEDVCKELGLIFDSRTKEWVSQTYGTLSRKFAGAVENILEGLVRSEKQVPTSKKVVAMSALIASDANDGSANSRNSFLVCKLKVTKQLSPVNGFVRLTTYDMTGSLPCIVNSSSRVELTEGVWLFNCWDVAMFAVPSVRLPLQLDAKVPGDVPVRLQRYVQLTLGGWEHPSCTRLDEWCAAMGSRRFDTGESMQRKVILNRALSIAEIHKLTEVDGHPWPALVALRFTIRAVSPVLSYRNANASSSEQTKQVLLLASDKGGSRTVTIELRGRMALDWYPFLLVGASYALTNLKLVEKDVSGNRLYMLVPTSSIDEGREGPGPHHARKKRRRAKPTLVSCSSGSLHLAGDNEGPHTGAGEDGDSTADRWHRCLRGTVSYQGTVTGRLAQDVFELDGPGGYKLLLSNSGESCTNGGVAIVPGAEIVACNVHRIYTPFGKMKGFGTCSVSQIQIANFSKRPCYGQVLRRAKSHAKGLYRHFGLNLRESLWVNDLLRSLETDFFRSAGPFGLLREFDPKRGGSGVYIMETLLNHFQFFNRTKRSAERSSVDGESRCAIRRNVFLEFLFHERFCQRNIDFSCFPDEEGCPETNISLPPPPLPTCVSIGFFKTVPLECLKEEYEVSSSDMLFQYKVVPSKIVLKRAEIPFTLARLDGCSRTGQLVLQDDANSLPAVVNKSGNEDLLPLITQSFGKHPSRIVMLQDFLLAEESFGKRRGRRCAILDFNAIVPGATDTFGDRKFDYPYKSAVGRATDRVQPAVIKLRILSTSAVCAKWGAPHPFSCLECTINVEVLEPVVLGGHAKSGSFDKGKLLTLRSGALVYHSAGGAMQPSNRRTEALPWLLWHDGFPPALPVLRPEEAYELRTDPRGLFYGKTGNEIVLHRTSSFSRLAPPCALKGPKGSIHAMLRWYETQSPKARRKNTKVLCLVCKVKHVTMCDDSTKRRERVQDMSAYSGLLGVNHNGKKLKLLVEDINAHTKSDLYLSCSKVILPRGILPGATVQFNNMFFAVSNRGYWYFAETKTTTIIVLSTVAVRESSGTKREVAKSSLLSTPTTLTLSRHVPEMPLTLISSMYTPSHHQIASRKLCATVTHLHFVKIYRHFEGISWEASAYVNDGSGSALVKFDGRTCIELLQLSPTERVELEALCRASPSPLEYSPVRISVDHTEEGNSTLEIYPNERLLRVIRSSFESRKIVCFCRPLGDRSNQKTSAAVVRINEMPCDSLRTFSPVLKCCKLERVDYVHESYANLQEVLDSS